jgi:hypothetical protein
VRGIPYAPRVTDLANLVLAVDSTSVPKATAALDGLTAAGARAEAATLGLRGGIKGAGAEATAMAAGAQAAARAAVDQAAGFKASTDAVRLNTMAMRESLVVAREISRGNFTRLPGSLTILAQGISAQGGGLSGYVQALTQTLGIVKKVQDAELAEQAAATASAAAAVRAAAQRAGANILAADTEVGLAEAQARLAEGSTATAVAQARLAAAHEGVAAAAEQAAIAEDALAVAEGRASEAAKAAQASTVTRLGTMGKLLGLTTLAALGAEGAFKAFQATVDDSGALDKYAASLVKTKDQLKELEDKVGGFQITWGDVFNGIAKATTDAIGSSMWDNLKEQNRSGFALMLHNSIEFSSQVYGALRGTYQTIVDDWSKLPAVFGDAFYSAVNAAIGALNKLVKFGTDQINALIASVNKLPWVHLGSVSAPQIGAVDNPYAGSAKGVGSDLSANVSKYTGQARGALQGAANAVYQDILDAAEERIKGGAPKDKKGRAAREKQQPADHADDMIAKLDEEILSAKIALTKDANEEAALKVQQLRVARDKTINDAAQMLVEHKITASEFEMIKVRAEELDNLKEKAVLNARDIALLTQQQAVLDQTYGFQLDGLRFADEMATTADDHRKAQLAILKVVYDQKLADLKILEEKQRIAGDLAAVRLTQGKIAQLPTEQAQDQARTLQRTMNPLEAWAKQVPHDAASINEALQSIQVKGFDGIASAIAGVVTGTESLGKAFKDVARSIVSDIIQMTVKMLIFRAISGIFGKVGGSGGGGVVNLDIGAFPARAGGGPVGAGQTYMVGERGPELFRPSSAGTIIPNHKLANDNGGGEITLRIVTDGSFEAQVQQIAGQVVVQAAPIIVKTAAQTTVQQISRKTLNGR